MVIAQMCMFKRNAHRRRKERAQNRRIFIEQGRRIAHISVNFLLRF